MKYVLPTEAMWEYAARGGGHKKGTEYAGSESIDEVAWYSGNSYDVGESDPDYGVHRVGLKKANALGIFDMSGNVCEWCSDWYAERYEPDDSHNPQGPATGTYRVERGGSWSSVAGRCRVSSRRYDYPDSRSNILGFRVAVLLWFTFGKTKLRKFEILLRPMNLAQWNNFRIFVVGGIR